MRHARLRTEAATWRSLPAAERQRYGADFVAVLDGSVIDQDAARAKLVQRIRRRFGDAPVLITPANAEGVREFRHIGGLKRTESQ